MKQFRSIDRATTELKEAYDYFDRLRQTFPDSPYSKSAEEHMRTCRQLMAEHELYIADVFWHMKKYGPAWHRYEYIMKNFKDVPEVADHAKEKSLAAYHNYREAQSQEVREKREGSWKRWFTWL